MFLSLPVTAGISKQYSLPTFRCVFQMTRMVCGMLAVLGQKGQTATQVWKIIPVIKGNCGSLFLDSSEP